MKKTTKVVWTPSLTGSTLHPVDNPPPSIAVTFFTKREELALARAWGGGKGIPTQSRAWCDCYVRECRNRCRCQCPSLPTPTQLRRRRKSDHDKIERRTIGATHLQSPILISTTFLVLFLLKRRKPAKPAMVHELWRADFRTRGHKRNERNGPWRGRGYNWKCCPR